METKLAIAAALFLATGTAHATDHLEYDCPAWPWLITYHGYGNGTTAFIDEKDRTLPKRLFQWKKSTLTEDNNGGYEDLYFRGRKCAWLRSVG